MPGFELELMLDCCVRSVCVFALTPGPRLHLDEYRGAKCCLYKHIGLRARPFDQPAIVEKQRPCLHTYVSSGSVCPFLLRLI